MKKEGNIVVYSEEELDKIESTGTDWACLDSMTDDEIDVSDIPVLDDEFWKNAKLVDPSKRQHTGVKLDYDVQLWFKLQDIDFDTHINAVLRKYMENCEAR